MGVFSLYNIIVAALPDGEIVVCVVFEPFLVEPNAHYDVSYVSDAIVDVLCGPDDVSDVSDEIVDVFGGFVDVFDELCKELHAYLKLKIMLQTVVVFVTYGGHVSTSRRLF